VRRAVLILDPLPGLHFVGAPFAVRVVRPSMKSLRNLTDSALNPHVLVALREISRRLTEATVRHAVIGGLAVGVYGWPRATRDVDLLLGDEAWDRARTGELRPRVPLPEQIDGVAIDYLPLDVAGQFLESAVDRPLMSDGIPIAPPEVVVCTKLLRMAMRDQADIVEIVKAGLIDRDPIRRYLEEHTPMLLGRWDALVVQADAELGREG
jgi:hypothetical protein